MDLSAKLSLNKPITPLQILVAVLPFITGIFYEWQSALVAVALLALLIIDIIRTKEIEVDLGFPLFFTFCVVICHMLTAIWAVDKGMVWMGVVKFLPLPLFVLAAARKDDLLRFVPHSGALMTVLSVSLCWIDALKGHIIVSGRIGGFFEYPNAFAMFLLVCLILVLFKEKITIVDWIFAVIYIAGIALSGSRTVMALTAVTAIVFIIWVKDKKIKIISLIAFVIAAAVAGVYLYNKLSSLMNGSTFYGRFLYYMDALPVILKHPFGLGYYGYYYTQGEFQTGVYSVVHIHNDLLQILLDIGWVPAILGIVMVVRAFIKADFRAKIIMVMMILHMLFDFDMQFISMSIIFLTVVISSSKPNLKKAPSYKAMVPLGISVPIVVPFAIVFGLASFFNYIHDYETAVKVYPSYTEAQKILLTNAQTDAEMGRIADTILKHNPYYALANDAKARVAFANGDVIGMMGYKESAIKYNKYTLSEYLDYFDMLYYATTLYAQNNDYTSAEYCIDRCISLREDIRKVEAGTSKLGMMIDDKPDLTIPDQYTEYIDLLQSLKTT